MRVSYIGCGERRASVSAPQHDQHPWRSFLRQRGRMIHWRRVMLLENKWWSRGLLARMQASSV